MQRKRLRAPPLTVKRQEKRERRAEWAVAVKARDRVCQHEGHFSSPYWSDDTEAHHVLARSQGGEDVMSNGLGLCHEHHMWVHAHRIAAQALGLLAHVGDFSWLPEEGGGE